jgi:hypothetical protein
VTETGGHLAPVVFDRKKRKIQPYSIAPWVEEKNVSSLPLIQVLRGDFFCLPFGGNSRPFRGERHPVHGETANAKWKMEGMRQEKGRACLHLSLKTRIRPGRVDKHLCVIGGHNAVYCQHIVSGMRGAMDLGHHAMVKFPDRPGSGLIATSPFAFGQVFPGVMESPEARGYSMLKPGAEFSSLDSVPTITGQTTDVSTYPARRGFEDLVMLVSDQPACPVTKRGAPFAWNAVTFPQDRYVWFALRDPQVLRSTILWISNGGRHYPPWNGRHVNVMGLEDVTSFFHLGLADSAEKNSLSARGCPTCLPLKPNRPLVVNYIMGVAVVPASFDRVRAIEAENQAVRLKSASGASVTVPLDLGFLRSVPLA